MPETSPQLPAKFALFLERARPLAARLARCADSDSPLEAFQAFIDAGKSLVSERRARRMLPAAVFDRFTRFLTDAEAILLEPMRKQYQRLAIAVEPLEKWLLPASNDLFAVAGLTHNENAYTELIRWAMCPQTNASAAVACQCSWLQSLRPTIIERADQAAIVQSQYNATGHYPDLVMTHTSFAVVVEAKTWSAEHVTRSEKMQTIAYPVEVRKVLGWHDERPIYVVFLTLDRSPASNSDARLCSYFELALAFARGLENVELDSSLRAAYAMVITHLANRAG